MKKTILVTGASGFVAGSILAQAPEEWNIHGVCRSVPGNSMHAVQYHALDLLNEEAVVQLLEAVRPDVIIHTAALADIDYCQRHQQEAEAINVRATECIASWCGTRHARLIFCSTDTVFDGLKGNYSEPDSPNPVNYYAETKVRGEQAVLDVLSDAVVARLSLVMGFPCSGAGNSFLAKMVRQLRAGEEVCFPDNEIRTPVDVISLGRALLELAENEYCGYLHLAGSTRLNRFEMAKQIAVGLGCSDAQVHPVNSNALPGRARRPEDASLNNERACTVLNTPMLALDEAIELIIKMDKELHHDNA